MGHALGFASQGENCVFEITFQGYRDKKSRDIDTLRWAKLPNYFKQDTF